VILRTKKNVGMKMPLPPLATAGVPLDCRIVEVDGVAVQSKAHIEQALQLAGTEVSFVVLTVTVGFRCIVALH
jgi:hypothetical protein